MVNEKEQSQRTHRRRPWALRALTAVTVLSACNAILDNDPRTLDPSLGGLAGHGPGAGGRRDDANGGAGEGGSATAGTAASAGTCPGAAGEGGASTCAPPGENCVPGVSASQEVPCGACNAGAATVTHTCSADGTWGPWSAPGACQISVECTPGEPGTQTTPCGACMTGKVTKKRTCTDACTWGPWDAGGECTGVTAACVPGNQEPRTVSCPCSGTKTQTRTCSSACAWGEWSDTSSCNLECCTQLVYCDTPDSVAKNRGTWCRRTDPDCTKAEVDSDCKAMVEDKCNVFTQPVLTEY